MMKTTLFALFSGLLFGFGISLSGMTNPNTVIGFLDITGDWNASLMFVLLSAVTTTFISFKWILKQQKPVCDSAFHLPQKTKVDKQLITGAAIFGIGWGMAGYCPGAVLAAMTSLNQEVFIFIFAMLIGMLIAKKLNF